MIDYSDGKLNNNECNPRTYLTLSEITIIGFQYWKEFCSVKFQTLLTNEKTL